MEPLTSHRHDATEESSKKKTVVSTNSSPVTVCDTTTSGNESAMSESIASLHPDLTQYNQKGILDNNINNDKYIDGDTETVEAFERFSSSKTKTSKTRHRQDRLKQNLRSESPKFSHISQEQQQQEQQQHHQQQLQRHHQKQEQQEQHWQLDSGTLRFQSKSNAEYSRNEKCRQRYRPTMGDKIDAHLHNNSPGRNLSGLTSYPTIPHINKSPANTTTGNESMGYDERDTIHEGSAGLAQPHDTLEFQWSDEEYAMEDSKSAVSKEKISSNRTSANLVDCNLYKVMGSRSRVPEAVRLRVNMRERQRMHDLNSALDSLRQVMPYSSGPSVKKLSKMSTLLLARNYIVMLSRSLEEMRRLVQELSVIHNKPATAQTPLSHVANPNIAPSIIPTNPSVYTSIFSAFPSFTPSVILPPPLIPSAHALSTLPQHQHKHQHQHQLFLEKKEKVSSSNLNPPLPQHQQGHQQQQQQHQQQQRHHQQQQDHGADFLTCTCSECLSKKLKVATTHWGSQPI